MGTDGRPYLIMLDGHPGESIRRRGSTSEAVIWSGGCLPHVELGGVRHCR